jgi:polysaccharide pyruvyl transferase WcaK-like protein
MGRPVVAISYHRKVTAHMQDMGLPWAVVDVSVVSVAKLSELFERVWAHRADLGSAAVAATGERRRRVTTHVQDVLGTVYRRAPAGVRP